ncbi:MAG: toll/interleukin-1 receptor domain-containing protein [Actinomycetota bacterium]|nr:toll/interleukin-1 receptor domain-containing protein [Actinomycetota bacterium]
MSANIFISYRREDASGHAGRLFDSLSARFGEDRIFMDIDSIGPGVDFEQVIEGALESSKVVLVVIGRQWETVTGDSGQRRLEDPGDFVRLEVAAALRRSDLVVPVLVQGTTMPRVSNLPPDLAALTHRNAWELSDARWSYDLSRLSDAIRRVIDDDAETVVVASGRAPRRTPENEDKVLATEPQLTPTAPARSPQVVWGTWLLLATLLFGAGLLMPFIQGQTMLTHARGEPIGVTVLALLLSVATILGVIRPPGAAGAAFGLGLAALLTRLVVVLKIPNVDNHSLSSTAAEMTLIGAAGLMIAGAIWAHQVSPRSHDQTAPILPLGAGVLGVAIRTASMVLHIHHSKILIAQPRYAWVGLPFFLAICLVAFVVLRRLAPFAAGFVGAVGAFAAELVLRILSQFAKADRAATAILILALAAMVLAGVLRTLDNTSKIKGEPLGI